MNNNPYIGNDLQISGVEEYRLVGGKGDGMRLLHVRNGLGLDFIISVDRCADISRLNFRGINYGYFSPTGYVSPSYYDDKGIGFIKSFTAGFLTTCGLTAVGKPCVDEGQELPLHGRISNTPADKIYYTEDDNKIIINAHITEGELFSYKLSMNRSIICSKTSNKIVIEDTIKNIGDQKTPCMILYHMNIGYPLLSENSKLYIPSDEVVPRNEHAARDIQLWDKMIKPQKGFVEQCYYHFFKKEGKAIIFNPDINKGLEISFDPRILNYFVEWKMMGYKDYVLGLEPGNCHPDGRDVMRKENKLKFLDMNEKVTYRVELKMLDEFIIKK